MDYSKLIDIIQAVYYYVPRMTRDQVHEVLQTLISLMETFYQTHSLDPGLLHTLETAVNIQKQTRIHGLLE
jgi:Tfp pilus assembly protein PilE